MNIKNSLLSALLAVPLAISGMQIASAETLNLYTVQASANLPQVQGMQRLADLLEERTSGELKIQVHLAGTLQIDAGDVTTAVASNVVQMADDFVYSGNVPVAGVVRLPLIIGSRDDLPGAKAAAFDIAKEAYAEKGVTLLGSYTVPPQVVWLTSEATGIDDIKGKKLRVSSSEQGEMIKALGGVPITLPPADVTASLERGVVDGMVTAGLGGAYFGGPTKSAVLLPVNFSNDYIIINTSVYEGLSEEHQKLLSDLATEVGQWTEDKFFEVDDAAVKEFRDRSDFSVIDPTEEEMARATELAKPIWDAWLEANGERGKAIFDAVRAAVTN